MRRHKHSLSHYKLLTCDMGELVPCGCVEVLPGDTFQQRTSVLIRVSPLVAPVMHPVQVRVHHWYVPNRILWDGWENFITGGPDGTDSSNPPTTTAGGSRSILDYLGIAPGSTGNFNALPLYAVNTIYNEYYRDQDLAAVAAVTSGPLKHVSWEKDYFTSARPWPQKGPDVTLPLGTKAMVRHDISGAGSYSVQAPGGVETMNSSGAQLASGGPAGASANQLYADLSTAEAINVNDFRRAFAVQRYQEARARYGSRFTEYLRYAFGVASSDARLQRPEYLGGGKQTIQFSEVLQTTEATGNPLGRMGGHGIAAVRTRRYRRFFEEHGYILSLLSVRPKAMYAEGVTRHWLKKDKEDYFQRELAHIGQQPVYNQEIKGTHATPTGVFGWQDRYVEYKHQKSSVAAEFRSTLDYWHLARKFATDPALNETFIKCVPSKRIHAEQTNNSLWCMVNHSIQARRHVPKSAASRIV